ncbi:hypothetical protein PHET_12247 [Paragonimus heterotremus]|uniref:Uncharacterized protein n=1 Tax=Paragonimus heterotremus TaxID=100268 RepID=A0A8J4SY18_9TREM|nr:hypothetical protein PHET_12247 [Paragonimus heterotremus]
MNDSQARLDYLIKYCDGPAKASIQHCTILEEDRGYVATTENLRKRFGQNHMVAKAHTDELLDGPRLTDNDCATLVQLAQQMTVCEVTLRQLNYDSDLNSSGTVETTVRRLPPELDFGWANEAAIITRSNRELQFTNLTRFVEERADATSLRYGERAISLKSELHDGPRQMNARTNPVSIRRNIHLERLYQQDFIDAGPMKEKEMSVDDRQAIGLMDTSIRLTDGHHEVALPRRLGFFLSPDNRSIALKRLHMLRQRLMKCNDLV